MAPYGQAMTQACDPQQGDHAAQWETSVTWAAEPDTVDPRKFPAKGEPNPPGVMGEPVADITPELAGANMQRAVDGLASQARALLDQRSK